MLQLADMEHNTLEITLNALGEKLKLINVNPQTLTENNISKSVFILSPINGFVAKVNANIGKYATPSDVLFELINPNDIHLNLKVFEKDLKSLFIGQKLFAFSNSESAQKQACEVILISQNLSENHSAEVHCRFKNYDKTLLPGMYMNAEIELKNNKCQALSEESVVYFEGKNYIFIHNGKQQYTMREVETGSKENGFIEIKNTETIDNQTIVTKGAYTLLMVLKNKEEE